MPGGILNSIGVSHSPQGDDHADGEKYTSDDTTYTKEEHFRFDITDDACLLGDMKMINESLQAFFIHKISEVTQRGGQHKEEDGCACDDGDLDPFQFCEERDTQEEDVPGKSDKHGDEEGVLVKEWKGGGILADGKQDDDDDDQGADPP